MAIKTVISADFTSNRAVLGLVDDVTTEILGGYVALDSGYGVALQSFDFTYDAEFLIGGIEVTQRWRAIFEGAFGITPVGFWSESKWESSISVNGDGNLVYEFEADGIAGAARNDILDDVNIPLVGYAFGNKFKQKVTYDPTTELFTAEGRDEGSVLPWPVMVQFFNGFPELYDKAMALGG